MNKIINAVGVEMEGVWYSETTRDLDHSEYRDTTKNVGPRNIRYKDHVYLDGSVHLRTHPMDLAGEVSYHDKRLASVIDWMLKFYPDRVNNSCGLHVHISLTKNIYYMKLLTRRFQSYLDNRFTEWGKANNIERSDIFWHRLENGNRFCRKTFRPEKQIFLREKVYNYRYTQLNFCYGLHRTFEYRALPMFKDAILATSAVCTLVHATTVFIREELQKKEKTWKAQVEIEQHDLQPQEYYDSEVICL